MVDPVPLLQSAPPPAPPVGLINSAPPPTTANPTTPPTGAPPSGSQVTGYNPATAAAAAVEAKPFEVPDDAVVSSRLKGIIAAGSPLIQQAEANARAQMNRRGLINSSAAITAGQRAVNEVALPIATSEAAAFGQAARDTTTAENAARAFNATGAMDTSKFNAGQQNAALSQAATASNQVGLTAQQIQGSKDVAEIQGMVSKEIARLQADTSLTLQDKVSATSLAIANINANTSLSVADKQAATQTAIADMQAMTSRGIAQLQADTTLTAQDKAIQGQQALQGLQSTLQTQLANIQADTSMSIADKQSATQKIVAQMSGDTQKQVQELQNAGALANIAANGQVSTRLQVLGDQNKLLLQNSAGAAQLYSNALQAMNQIMLNEHWNGDQKSQMLNNTVQSLSDSLSVMSGIAGTPGVSSLLNFSNPNDPTGAAAGPAPGAPANDNAAAINSVYRSVLGRSADADGLAYWEKQVANGMPLATVKASMRQSDEYKRMTGAA